MRRTLLLATLALAVLVAVLLARAARFSSRQLAVDPMPVVAVDEGAVTRLADALRFRTVSYQDSSQFEEKEFLGLHRLLGAHRVELAG